MQQLPYPKSSSPDDLLDWAKTLVAQMGQTVAPAVPSGIVSAFAGATAPDGWLICDGRLLTRQEQPGLYRAIGFRFNTGGETTDEFRLPDARGRSFVALSSTLTSLYGGAATSTIDLSHLPALSLPVTDSGHVHGFTPSSHTHTVNDPTHSHNLSGNVGAVSGTTTVAAGGTTIDLVTSVTRTASLAATGVTLNSATQAGSVDSHTSGISVALNGGGNPFSLMSPYFTGFWIIKT